MVCLNRGEKQIATSFKDFKKYVFIIRKWTILTQRKHNFFMWDFFIVINYIGRVPIGWSSLKYFMPSVCSLNCANTLQWRTGAYSLSLSYYSQFLISKGAKDFSIQFFSTILYFNNLSVEEENVFFVLLSFFALWKGKEQPK